MLGPPGTGKTTVARLLGEAYREVGCLSKGHLVEVDSGDLIAEYVGQTAPKTGAVIDSAMGGVLFIDEAYQLASGSSRSSGGGSFGDEAITTLLKRMEDDREDLVVIVAGYTDEMDEFLGSNPGLASRFGETIDFPSYSTEELLEIAAVMVRDRGYVADPAVIAEMVKRLEPERDRSPARFGNGRSVRRILEATQREQSVRLGKHDLSELTDEALTELLLEDIPSDF
jgi:SpoVK/Ycf46/Vps4 family AAA+-type ATPase